MQAPELTPPQQPVPAVGEMAICRPAPGSAGPVMNTVTLVALVCTAPVVAIGIHDLQAKLERWAYERHDED